MLVDVAGAPASARARRCSRCSAVADREGYTVALAIEVRVRAILVLLSLMACGAQPSGPPPLDTAGGSTSECSSEQIMDAGGLAAGWRSPAGTLFAIGPAAPRLRAADGTWSLDPEQLPMYGAFAVHGSGDDEVWAITRDGAFRRGADGIWVDMAALVELDDLEGVHVFGPDDVMLLKVEELNCADCYSADTPVLLWWDGAVWTEERHAMIDGPIFDMAVLPDRTVVLAADGGLLALGAPSSWIPTPPELYIRQVTAAADGTLVALDENELVAIGDATSGLVLHDPGLPGRGWLDAWASTPDDVWISGTHWDLGEVRQEIVHWDGTAWSSVLADYDSEVLSLAGGDGQLFALGDVGHELVLVGDAGGLSVDREIWGPPPLRHVAVDDLTGQPWGVGYGSVLGVYEGDAWRGEPLPDRMVAPDAIVASGGRIGLIEHGDALYVYEGGELTTTPTPDTFYSALAGAEGVLFAVGRVGALDEEGGSDELVVVRDDGTGWTPLDLTGISVDAMPVAIWADGANDLWLALLVDGKGALAHWDGATWTLPVVDLPSAPGWLARLSDGKLYFTQFDGPGVGVNTLWVYDGVAAAPVPDAPLDVRAAHLLPDGTWFASVIALASTSDESLYGALMQRDPGGTWAEVLVNDYSIAIAGQGDTLWATYGVQSWTWSCCVP